MGTRNIAYSQEINEDLSGKFLGSVTHPQYPYLPNWRYQSSVGKSHAQDKSMADMVKREEEVPLISTTEIVIPAYKIKNNI
jgi:hypothetical protein